MKTFLRLVQRQDKSLVVPEIIVKTLDFRCGGYYEEPDKDGSILDDNGKEISTRKGALVIAREYCYDENFMLNSIAHEWRHHWQRFNTKWASEFPRFKEGKSYRQNIISFFSSSSLEMDALMFSQKIAPCDSVKEWISWLEEAKVL